MRHWKNKMRHRERKSGTRTPPETKWGAGKMEGSTIIHNFFDMIPFLTRLEPLKSAEFPLSNGPILIKNGSILKKLRISLSTGFVEVSIDYMTFWPFNHLICFHPKLGKIHTFSLNFHIIFPVDGKKILMYRTKEYVAQNRSITHDH